MGTFNVEDVFHVTGRGFVVTGRGLTGEFKLGDIVHVVGNEDKPYTITAVERFVNQLGKPVRPGESAGFLLREVQEREEVPSGSVLSHYDYVL
jgi:elongation factor Tu